MLCLSFIESLLLMSSFYLILSSYLITSQVSKSTTPVTVVFAGPLITTTVMSISVIGDPISIEVQPLPLYSVHSRGLVDNYLDIWQYCFPL